MSRASTSSGSVSGRCSCGHATRPGCTCSQRACSTRCGPADSRTWCPATGRCSCVFDGTEAGRGSCSSRPGVRPAQHDRAWAAWAGRRSRRVIPVHYGGDDGPDLEAMAALAGLSPEAFIREHAERDYPVLFLGFAPGFAYCGDLPPVLAVPRLGTPRTTTPPGSVAVAEGYTGHLSRRACRAVGGSSVGRSVVLFDPTADPPTYLLPGDTVRFTAVDRADVPAAPYRAADWSGVMPLAWRGPGRRAGLPDDGPGRPRPTRSGAVRDPARRRTRPGRGTPGQPPGRQRGLRAGPRDHAPRPDPRIGPEAATSAWPAATSGP